MASSLHMKRTELYDIKSKKHAMVISAFLWETQLGIVICQNNFQIFNNVKLH